MQLKHWNLLQMGITGICTLLYLRAGLEEIAQVIDQLGFEFDGDAFLAFTKNPPSEIRSDLQLPAGRSLEGYMHPANIAETDNHQRRIC